MKPSHIFHTIAYFMPNSSATLVAFTGYILSEGHSTPAWNEPGYLKASYV